MVYIFCWGVFGSLAVEFITIMGYPRSSSGLPSYYYESSFWAVRCLATLLAGGVAVANDVSMPHLAIQVGAGAPLIIQALARGIR